MKPVGTICAVALLALGFILLLAVDVAKGGPEVTRLSAIVCIAASFLCLSIAEREGK